MSEGSNRLPADAPHGLGGAEIDRSRPLRFRLNGRTIDGFAGDTVLSATLAAGIQIAGRHGDEAIALDESFSPLVQLGKDVALPMDRTPALDGLDFTTIGTRRDPIASDGLLGLFRHRLVGPARTLNHRFEDDAAPLPPWHAAAPTETQTVDFVVIGGGVAGLSAAAAASPAGKSVVLIERNARVGGNIGYFGAVDGEDTPAVMVKSLVGSLGPGVSILTHAEAFAISGSTVLVHQVVVTDGLPASRVLAIEAKHVVLATGAVERLPIFSGNRTPGIVSGVAAHQRAARFGVWPGRRSLFTTPHSFAYRLALHASDAGVEVQRIVDARIAPLSRFIDFAKASGITLASALAPGHAEPLQRNQPGLRVDFAVTVGTASPESAAIETDQLVASGGWQPDILLWLRSRGSARWDASNGWLAAVGTLPAMSVVGSAAGWRSTAAAVTSGRAAVLAVLGKAAPSIVEHLIDTDFETPDAHTSVAPPRPQAKGNAYLDRGASLITRRAAAAGKHGVSGIATRAVQLSLGDIAAAVDIGLIAPRDAGPVAAERCGLAGQVTDTGWQVPAPASTDANDNPAPPGYLTGRFGDKPQVWALSAADARSFGAGCLVFENSHTTDPLKAIGVTYAPPRPGANGGIALMAPATEGTQLFVRDAGTAVAARLTEKLKL